MLQVQRAASPVDSVETLKPALDRLYATFNRPDSAVDPIHLVRRYERPDDREIVAFIASGLAFGRVASVLQSVERVLAVLGPNPADAVRAFRPARDAREFAGIGHRWVRSPDLVALVWVLRQMLDTSGSIESFFADGDARVTDDEDVGVALDRFSAAALTLDLRAAYGRTPRRPGVACFFARPSAGSACKRLNLFLRWMVRRDALDLGVWSRVRPSQLIIPLDTHVIRVGRCLGLTRYVSPGWRMAHDITRSLRALDPDDPVKYDFAMCHLGMMDACGFSQPRRDAACPLRGVCRPGARTRQRSPRPSARR